jgi:hypothetical protein
MAMGTSQGKLEGILSYLFLIGGEINPEKG